MWQGCSNKKQRREKGGLPLVWQGCSKGKGIKVVGKGEGRGEGGGSKLPFL